MTPDGESWSWAQLYTATLYAATTLRNRGVARGDRVVLLAPNGPEYMVLLAACAALGAVFVPLNTRLSAAEVRIILDDAAPQCVVIHPMHRQTFDGATPARAVLSTDEILPGEQRTAEPLLAGEDLVAARRGEEAALMMYTSGTTGVPKGAVLTHAALLWNARQFIEELGLTAEDRQYAVAPLFHIAGLNTLTTPLLYLGGTTVFAESFEPERMAMAMRGHSITCAFMVPQMWRRLSQVCGADCAASMRIGLVGGAPCAASLRQEWGRRGVHLAIGYGMTEACPMVTTLPAGEPMAAPGDVGWPARLVEVDVRAFDGPRSLEVGQRGEVCVRAPNLMLGYWRGEDVPLDRGRFEGEWFRTGDIGHRTEDGRVILTGRTHDMIITGGENVYPIEVERVLDEIAAIDDAAVLGLPDQQWGEAVVAAIVWRDKDKPLECEQVRSLCRAHLAGYKLPKKIFAVDDLPRNPTGKIDRAALRTMLDAATPQCTKGRR